MNKIIGKNINFRLTTINDAEFILDLRLKKGEYLSATKPNLDGQIEWLKNYKTREESGLEYYFIIENKSDLEVGTVRLYNINKSNKTFTFGSFIVDRDLAHQHSALEAMILIFEFAFDNLLLKNCFFDCRKNNQRANSFYLRFGAKIIKEDELDYFFNFTVADYQIVKQKYNKFL